MTVTLKSAADQAQPGRVRLALGRPALHAVVGALFATLFTWPIVAFDAPLNTWTLMYATWALAVVALFVLSRGEDPVDPDSLDEATDDTVASVPAPGNESTYRAEGSGV
jgi:hypothetical protein